MRILCISDHHRHELGCAAALKTQNYDVTYLAIGSAPSLPLTNIAGEEIIVKNRHGHH